MLGKGAPLQNSLRAALPDSIAFHASPGQFPQKTRGPAENKRYNASLALLA